MVIAEPFTESEPARILFRIVCEEPFKVAKSEPCAATLSPIVALTTVIDFPRLYTPPPCWAALLPVMLTPTSLGEAPFPMNTPPPCRPAELPNIFAFITTWVVASVNRPPPLISEWLRVTVTWRSTALPWSWYTPAPRVDETFPVNHTLSTRGDA